MLKLSLVVFLGCLVSAASMAVGWASPEWRWGSAGGAAHDEAMRVRALLSTPAERAKFCASAEVGTADFEDLKLVLALKCQRARNLGYDEPGASGAGSGAGLWEALMNDMASCWFEGDGGPTKLQAAIAAKLAESAAREASDPNVALAIFEANGGATPPSQTVARAFERLEFVERGL